MSLALLLLAACAPDDQGVSDCDAATENCCVGTIADASVDGLKLSVAAEVVCDPQNVSQWTLYLDGVTASSGPGLTTSASIDIDLDLRPFDLAQGGHTLSLWAVPDLDVAFLEVASTTITVSPDRPDDDSGDTGDTTTEETAEETADTGPQTVDLTISAATLDLADGVPGTPLSLDLSVANLGTASADATVTAYWSVDSLWDPSDLALATLTFGAVNGGDARAGTMLLDVPADTTPGVRYVLVEVETDANDLDPGNDLAAVPFTVDGPALEADTFNVAPGFGIPGDVLAATWRAKNSGPVDASGVTIELLWSADAVVDKDDSVLASWTESTLTAYGSTSGTTDITLPEGGSGYVLFLVDSTDTTPEADESDNVATFAVEVSDIDLTTSIEALSDTSVSLGDRLDADIAISNAGMSDASGFNVSLYLSDDAVFDAGDTLLGSEAAGIVAAGTSVLVSVFGEIPEGAPVGGINVFAVVDAEDYVRERNESNNTDNLDLDVSAPDLVPEINGASSTTLVRGDAFTVDVRVGNWTAVGTTLPLEADLYLSTDTTWDAADTWLTAITLPPASAWDVGTDVTSSATIPTSATSGPAWLIVLADPADLVSEEDESNNTDSFAVTLR